MANPLEMLPREHAEVIRSPRGIIYVWRPAPGALVTRVEGTLVTDAAVAIERLQRRVVSESGKAITFHDWERMTDYDTEARLRLTSAAAGIKGSVEGIHLLIASRVVALGVRAANLMVNILTVYTSRRPFEAALRDALRRRLNVA